MTNRGLAGVRWSLDFVILTEPTSFSLENVVDSANAIIRLFEEYRARYPNVIDFEIFQFGEYGTPADRTRVIAATPYLIERMRSEESLKRPAPSVKGFFEAEPWPEGEGVLSTNLVQGNNHRKERIRRVEKTAYTVTGEGLKFVLRGLSSTTGEYVKCVHVRSFSTLELARVMTFPASYTFPDDATQTSLFKAIGNSVPPLISHLLLGGDQTSALEAGLTNTAAPADGLLDGPDDSQFVEHVLRADQEEEDDEERAMDHAWIPDWIPHSALISLHGLEHKLFSDESPGRGLGKLIVDKTSYDKPLSTTCVSVQSLVGRPIWLTQGTQSISTEEDFLRERKSAMILQAPPSVEFNIHWSRDGDFRISEEGECRLGWYDGIVRARVAFDPSIDYQGANTEDVVSSELWRWNAAWAPHESHALPVATFLSDEPMLFAGFRELTEPVPMPQASSTSVHEAVVEDGSSSSSSSSPSSPHEPSTPRAFLEAVVDPIGSETEVDDEFPSDPSIMDGLAMEGAINMDADENLAMELSASQQQQQPRQPSLPEPRAPSAVSSAAASAAAPAAASAAASVPPARPQSILPDHPALAGISPDVKQQEIDDVLACIKTPRPIQLEQIYGVDATTQRMNEIIFATLHPGLALSPGGVLLYGPAGMVTTPQAQQLLVTSFS